MNVFPQSDYRECLRLRVLERKMLNSKNNFHALADAMRVQRPFLSKVIRGSAHLNEDQLYLACKALEFSEKEANFLGMLLRCHTSQLAVRKAGLDAEIDRLRQEQSNLSKVLGSQRKSPEQPVSLYYLDPLHQIVHMALDIPRYQNNINHLAADLGISVGRCQSCLDELERANFIVRDSVSTKVVRRDVHLDRASPEYAGWYCQLRILGMRQILQSTRDLSHGFSVVFAADEETRTYIKESFVQLLQSIRPRATAAPARDVYQMNFDLFAWTNNQ